MVKPMLLKALALALGTAQAAVPSIPGFALTWSDDFIGTANSLPNPANWIVDIGTSYPGGAANWGTGEIQVYTSSPANLKLTGDGKLRITMTKNGNTWNSARIETQRKDFLCADGKVMRIQGSISLPNVSGPAAAGYWAAFWTLGGNFRGNYQNWPSIGEFDIMENVNGVNSVFSTLHCDVAPGGACNEFTGLSGSRQCPGTPCQGNFHTYTFEVDRTQELEAIRWFIDGLLYWQVVSTDITTAAWNQAVHNGHFVLLNLAMGGAFPNANAGFDTPTAATQPGYFMDVEYVAVYNSV